MFDIAALYEAASVAEAIELRRAHPEARLIAGGSDLLVKIRDGKLTGAELISIRGIAELAGVCEMPDGTLKIGPLTSFSQLAADTLIRERMPVLGEAADEVGGPQIRNIGTVGGNICNGVTSADTAPTLFACDAELELTGAGGTRRLGIAEFYLGPGRTDVGPLLRALHQIFHARGAGHFHPGLFRKRPALGGRQESGARAHSLRRGGTCTQPLPGDGARLRRRALHGGDSTRVRPRRRGGDKPAGLLARQPRLPPARGGGVRLPRTVRERRESGREAVMDRQFKRIRCTINGRAVDKMVDVRASLTDLLRDDFSLTSVKKGCEVGECGACTVLVDGETYNSCIYLAAWADGKDILTVDGLSGPDGNLSPIQQAFVDEGAIQCGFCTPGFLLTGQEILNRGEDLTDEQLRKQLAGHLCRCTGYENIFRAVRRALDETLGK